MTTITQVITAMPTAPSRSQAAAVFIVNADASVAAEATRVTEENIWATQANTVAGEVNANAVIAAAAASAAAASATAAASTGIKWVSGTTYADGDARWSPINYQTYRRKGAGAGTTDPSADSANWQAITAAPVAWSIKTGAYTAVVNDAIMANTTSAAFAILLPASPAANDVIRIADYAGTFATNNLTLTRNGNKINGSPTDMTCNLSNFSTNLTYIDATQGWRTL